MGESKTSNFERGDRVGCQRSLLDGQIVGEPADDGAVQTTGGQALPCILVIREAALAAELNRNYKKKIWELICRRGCCGYSRTQDISEMNMHQQSPTCGLGYRQQV